MRKILIIFFTFLILSAKVYGSGEETLIIFDASVSMINNFNGKPKYMHAIEEANKVLEKIPDSRQIGLRIIGVTIEGALTAFLQNPDKLCSSTKLLNPVQKNNIYAIKSSLESIFPLGTTPLTYTLNTAIEHDFSSSPAVMKHIILITDGAESCSGDPCKFIREVMRTRHDITIDVIAIGVNDDDFKQLNCLSSSTSGGIINITNPDQLENAFNKFFSPELNYDNRNYKNYFNKTNILYKNYLIETDY